MALSWLPERTEEQQLSPGTAFFTPHHCSAQPQSPYSVFPITFTFIYWSVRFFAPYAMPGSQNFISLLPTQRVMSLHCLSSSGSVHCTQLLQHQHPFPSADSSMQPSYHQCQPLGTAGTSCCPGTAASSLSNASHSPEASHPPSPLDNFKPTITASLSYNSFQSSLRVFPSHSTHRKDHS